MSQPTQVIMNEPRSTSPSGGNISMTQRPPAMYPAPQQVSMHPAPQQVSMHPSRNLVPVPQSGMAVLAQLNHVFVKQHIELLEILCGCETNNQYSVLTPNGQEFLQITEDTDACSRMCCGAERAFLMHISDFFGNDITVKRDCPCCCEKVTVSGPGDQVIGTIVTLCTFCPCCWIKINVLNERDEVLYRIEGTGCTMKCCGDITFSILPPKAYGDDEIGTITKKWSGFVQEIVSDADNFVLTFPQGATVNHKLALLGALLLLDFKFFERSGNKPNNRNFN